MGRRDGFTLNMKKIVVLSDSHGNIKGIEKLYPILAENDMVIHLGDGSGDLRSFMREYPEKTYVVAGNCDFFSPYPLEGEIEVEGVKIFYCHGHKYRVKSALYDLVEEAKKRDCQIALYGHTHRAFIGEIDGVTVINPGAFQFTSCYCYLVINGEKICPVIVGESI